MKSDEAAAWWQEVVALFKSDNNSERQYEVVDRADRALSRLPPAERRPILDLMAADVERDGEGCWLALALLRRFAEPVHASSVHRRVTRFTEAEARRSGGGDYLHLLVVPARGSAAEQDVIDAFLVRSPISVYHTGIMSSLLPQRPEAFAAAYARLLREDPPKEYHHDALVAEAIDAGEHVLAAIRRTLAGTPHLDAFERVLAAVTLRRGASGD